MRSSDDEFAQHFLGRAPSLLDRREDRFIRPLLLFEGDEEEIAQEAAERLLRGKPEPDTVIVQLELPAPAGPPEPDLLPSLRDLLLIEKQVLTFCDALGDQTDQDFEAIYSELRRRPDGRSLGPMHDLVWQVAALLLGRHPLSQAEFEALMGALVRSTRKWALRPISRNYVAYLRKTFNAGQAGGPRPL